MRLSQSVILFALFCSTSVFAQQGNSPIDLPHVDLQFSTIHDAPLTFPSPVMAGFPTCSADGAMYLEFMTNPPSYMGRALYEVSKRGDLKPISLNRLAGYRSIQIINYDANDHDVYLLLSAIADDSTGDERTGRYLAVFDKDGQLIRTTQLRLPIRPVKLATLGNDNLVFLGVDVGNAIPRVVLTDEHGAFLKYLDMGYGISSPDQLVQDLPFKGFHGDVPLDVKLTAALSAFQMSHAQGGLFLLQPGADTRVIKIGIGGNAEVIHLAVPHGVRADSILSSDRGLIVRGLVGGGNDSILMEFDPEDGSFLKEIRTGDVPSTSLACAHDGDFYGFRWIDKKVYLIKGSR